MQTRALGPCLTTSAIGLRYPAGPHDRPGPHPLVVLRGALELGVRLFDGSDDPRAEDEIRRALGAGGDGAAGAAVVVGLGEAELDPRPEVTRAALSAALRRLGTDHIDLCLVRMPARTGMVEKRVAVLAEAVALGDLGAIGLSVTNPTLPASVLRAVHAVHPVAAIRVEYSLWNRRAEAALLPAARALGAGILARAPLAGGLLAGRGPAPPPASARLARLHAMAADKDVSAARLALAWLLSRGPDVVADLATTSLTHLEMGVAALNVPLSAVDCDRLSRIFPPTAF